MQGRFSEKADPVLRLKHDKCFWRRVFAQGRRVIRGGVEERGLGHQGRPAGVPGDKRCPGVGGVTEDRVAVRAAVLR